MNCSVPYCTAVFHYPCAAASDSYLHLLDKKIICSQHMNDIGREIAADSYSCCAVCGDFACEEVPFGTAKDLLFCYTCGRHMHIGCLGLTGDSCGSNKKAGWQCQECKTCTICKSAGRSDKAVVCCDCGRDYHLQCLTPPLGGLPKLAWKCTSVGNHTISQCFY